MAALMAAVQAEAEAEAEEAWRLLRGLTSWAQGSSPPQLPSPPPQGPPQSQSGGGEAGRLAGPWNSLSAKQQTLTWGSTWAESASSNFHGGCGPSPGPLPRQPDPSPSPALGTSTMNACAAWERMHVGRCKFQAWLCHLLAGGLWQVAFLPGASVFSSVQWA